MRSFCAVFAGFICVSLALTHAQQPAELAIAGRIKEEGLQRSQAQRLYLDLVDGIGARLTGSPSHVKAGAIGA